MWYTTVLNPLGGHKWQRRFATSSEVEIIPLSSWSITKDFVCTFLKFLEIPTTFCSSCLKYTIECVEVKVLMSVNCGNSPSTLIFWYSTRTLRYVFGTLIDTWIIQVESIFLTKSSNENNTLRWIVWPKNLESQNRELTLCLSMPQKHTNTFISLCWTILFRHSSNVIVINSFLKNRLWFTTYFGMLHPILKYSALGLVGHIALNRSPKSSFNLSA